LLLGQNALKNKKNYYYSRLNDNQKYIYETLVQGISSYTEKIKVPPRPINELTMIYESVLLDNPLIFYTRTFKVSSDLNSKKRLLYPAYNISKKKVREYEKGIHEYLRVFDTAKALSNIEKVYFIHDYCLKHFTYDHSFNENSHSILGLILNKKAVCEGIARFSKLVFDYLGVKSLVVVGTAKNPDVDSQYEPHAWNILKINKETYHLDITFDMTISSKKIRYDYFNLCDEDIKKDHCITGNVPLCTSKGIDYFTVNSLIAGSYKKLSNIISDKVNQGEKTIMVKLVNVEDIDNMVDRVMKIAKTHCNKGLSTTTVSYNPSQCVFEISYK